MDACQFQQVFRRHIHRLGVIGVGGGTAPGQQPNNGGGASFRLADRCQRDLYVCILHLLGSLAEDPLGTFFRALNANERTDFLTLLT